MSLPHLQDWHFAGVRMGTTLLGAVVAVVAMRVLWPEHEQIELGKLLARGAAADAAYVRAMLRYWETGAAMGTVAEREVLAPARRSCGLSINDAEETLDRLMLEPRVGRASRWEEALTFVTFLRSIDTCGDDTGGGGSGKSAVGGEDGGGGNTAGEGECGLW